MIYTILAILVVIFTIKATKCDTTDPIVTLQKQLSSKGQLF
jgi:hypothetical protein